MASRRADICGERFGRLVVLRFLRVRSGTARWECRCDCGETVETCTGALRAGRIKSCGCLTKERVSEACTTHGASGTRLYSIWVQMIGRCHNKNHANFHRYGGRGITVCERWREDFMAFREDMGDPGEGLWLDRINNDGNYTPENCRWATPRRQGNNTSRNIDIAIGGATKTASQWARANGLNPHTALSRISRGWDPEKAVTVAVQRR